MRAILLCVGLLAAAAPALAEGRLRICASDLTNFDDTPRLDLPAGLVFAAWGQAGGDLRQARLDPNYPPARATGQAAVVLAAAVSLTADAPCTLAPARTLVSSQHNWRQAQLASNESLVFQAVDTLDGDDLRARASEHPGLYDVLAGNILAATIAVATADTMTIR